MPDTLFPTNDDELLISVYQKQGRTLDDLPYTAEFERVFADMYGGETQSQTPGVCRADVFHRLHNLRKAGKLPRLGRAKAPPPRIDAEEEQQLIALVEDEIGALSKRDQLLYQPAFEQIVARFNAATGRSLDHHAVWRIVAKLAK
jgi:hypothetical protein